MRDREILRKLAGAVAEIASLDVQRENAALYRALNSLAPIRPVVLMDELPWNQLDGDGELTPRCADEFLRSVETELLRTLYKWGNCRCDMIVEPFYRLNRAITYSKFFGFDVVEDTLSTGDDTNHIISHHYKDQIPDMAAIEKLRVGDIAVDDELTERRRAALDGIFGDILPIRVTGHGYAGFFLPWDDISRLRGVEPLLYDLYDDPDLMHALMRRYTDLSLARLKALEEMGLIDTPAPTVHCTAGLADDIPAPEGAPMRANIWGRGAAQIFATVSPKMHAEFEIAYAKEFFAGFPLVYYGCCEPLDDKIGIVEQIPNVRKLSITPWANVRKAAERMGKRYVLARKPNPAAVAVPSLDAEQVRREILGTLDICRETGTPCEFTLKDISSVSYNPKNLIDWARIAMETVKNY
ncbi:MAG: hypothetical protein ACOYI5_10000 [Christensenellales bacterium]